MMVAKMWPRGAGGYLTTLLGIAFAALVANWFDDVLNTLNISLIYLFVVLVAATSYGYGPAIMASVVGVFSFYVEFYPPYGFNSDLQLEDWFTLAFFLAFAIATSRLASAARSRAVEALAREHGAQTVQRLAEALHGGEEPNALAAAICTQVEATLGVARCAIDREGEQAATPGHNSVAVPLLSGGRMLGWLRIEPGPAGPLTEADRLILSAFAAQAGQAIERAALALEAHDADVLREADRLKTALLRTVSHDLRTPLATIKARASSVLEGDVAVTEGEWHEAMRAIDGEADRLSRLVGEVLDLSRLEAGAVPLRLEPYTADEVVSTVLPHLEAAGRGHRLQLDVDPSLPPVPLDIGLIHQLLANLLENAFKYAPPGSTVRLEAAALNGGLLLRVCDEGPGIPIDRRERVFDAFYRLDGPLERRSSGAGLGLAICKGIVVAHGGWIRAEEALGGGTAVLVWLPGDRHAACAAAGA